MGDHDDCSFRLLPMVQSLAEKYRASVISNANSASAPPNNDYPPVIMDGEVSAPSTADAETSLSNTVRRRSSRLNRPAPMSTTLNEDLMQISEGGTVVQRIPNTSCPMHQSDPSSSSAALVDGNVRSVLDVWSNQMHYNRMSEAINLRQSNDNCDPRASVASCGKPVSCPCPAESETSDGESMYERRRPSSSSYCSRLCKLIGKIISKKIGLPVLFLIVAITIGVAVGARVKYGKLHVNPVGEEHGPEETHGLGNYLLSLGDFIVTTIEPFFRNDDNGGNQ